jgi:RNA polymerase sigma factor FliA
MGQPNGASRRKPNIAQTARDRIVLENLSLVKAIAVRVHENLPVHVDLDDLVHAGVLGLFDAAEKYNPSKKVVFQSYAKHRIKGAILDSLRQLDWASRDLRRRQKQMESVTRELTARLGRAPSESEIADSLGISLERWRRVALELKNLGLLSASSLRLDPDNNAPVEFPAAPDSQPDRICAHEQLRSALASAMKFLPERYQKVIVLYYTKEMTMKEIGEILGVNESRVSQIHKVALEKMAATLHSAGIHSAGAF